MRTVARALHADLTRPPAEDIPDAVHTQMLACQTAANEFLRQFWLAIYPPPADLPTAAPAATPAQKAFLAKRLPAQFAASAGPGDSGSRKLDELTKGDAANIITRLRHGAGVSPFALPR